MGLLSRAKTQYAVFTFQVLFSAERLVVVSLVSLVYFFHPIPLPPLFFSSSHPFHLLLVFSLFTKLPSSF